MIFTRTRQGMLTIVAKGPAFENLYFESDDYDVNVSDNSLRMRFDINLGHALKLVTAYIHGMKSTIQPDDSGLVGRSF